MRLHDYLDFHAREAADQPFLRFGERVYTYSEARRRVHRLAHAMIAEGLSIGDRVGLLAKNCAEYAMFYFACSKAGVVPVPLNYRLAPGEWSYILQDAGAKLVLARAELAAALDSVRSELTCARRLIALDARAPAGWGDFETWLSACSEDEPARDVRPDSAVYQMYTSGTTGRPKGAVLTHRAIVSNVAQLQATVIMERGDRFLVPLPLYHAAGAMALFLTTACGGATHLQEDFVPQEVVRALSEDGIAFATMVPAMIQACLDRVPDAAQRTYPKLRRVTYGAAPIAERTLRRAMKVFRCEFAQGYGLTETAAVLTLLTPRDHERALKDRGDLLRSCGRPLLGTEVRIVDAAGNALPARQIGEIVARGPQLMSAYWNRDEATRKAFDGGWFHTDDVGMLDEEGYLYLIDRVKDMIVSGGENVYPSEVENQILRHPSVADVAVIGVPDPRWGEAVKAIVVLHPGALADEQLILEFCRSGLARYKTPKSVEFAAELPRNASGKVLKQQLREPYWNGHARRIA